MESSQQERRSGAVARAPRRRRYTIAQKIAIARECLMPGVSLAGVALAHRANANMVRKWVIKYQQGDYGSLAASEMGMLPVVVRKHATATASLKSALPMPVLEIELARGVVRFYGAIEETVLAPFIMALSGR